jgi:serine/threonine-protein kinase RIO1
MSSRDASARLDSSSISFSLHSASPAGSLSGFARSDRGTLFHATGDSNVKTPGRLPVEPENGTPALDRVNFFDSNLSQQTPWLAASGSLSRASGPPKSLHGVDESIVQTEEVNNATETRRSDNVDDNETTTRSSNGEDSKSPIRKVKIDISYMWDWDPNRARRSAALDTNAASLDSPSVASKLKATPSLEPIDEATTADPRQPVADPPSASMLAPVPEEDTKGVEKEKSPTETTQCQPRTGLAVPASFNAPSALLAPSTALSDVDASAFLAKTNRDFQHLLNESNVLRVNNVPYLKLRAIGKGGSGKVYRALAKDGSVVAIKKVKTAGMDRRTLALFANEIALLKRLRGNSEIIQMHDSQVDRTRNAIFVVMELGEADLNSVLQRQASRRQEGQLSVNIHFIRLMWQQMLSAVRCIHEARIVHGDLKPANFLLVKGALKLIDFGIAKAIQSDDTTSIMRENQIGTLNYMSPEAIEGRGAQGEQTHVKVGRVRTSVKALLLCAIIVDT